jgi:hypothetical protein
MAYPCSTGIAKPILFAPNQAAFFQSLLHILMVLAFTHDHRFRQPQVVLLIFLVFFCSAL